MATDERQLHAFHTGDRTMLLWDVLDTGQTQSYDQAVAVFEELMAMDAHKELNDHYQYPDNHILLDSVRQKSLG